MSLIYKRNVNTFENKVRCGRFWELALRRFSTVQLFILISFNLVQSCQSPCILTIATKAKKTTQKNPNTRIQVNTTNWYVQMYACQLFMCQKENNTITRLL